MADAFHSIQAVAQRTGLTAHVIRIWEKRYGAVTPERTDSNRRRYSEEQVERLLLLRELTQAGHSIGAVAALSTAKLRHLTAEAAKAQAATPRPAVGLPARQVLLGECVEAVRHLDAPALEAALQRGALELGAQGLLQRVIAPLAHTIGELWREGTITAAHEHFASAVLRVFLGHAGRSFSGSEGGPVLVVGTPSGQLHELGALLVGAAAAHLGWQVTYLGASLPPAEIAGAALQNRARAVALSLVYPEDDPRLEAELTRLRQLLPPEVPLLVGGRAMPAYREVLNKLGVLQMEDLAQLCTALDNLRKPAHKTKR